LKRSYDNSYRECIWFDLSHDKCIKYGAAFGSYGWSGEAPVMIAEKLRQLDMNVIDPVLRIQYQPTEKDLKECKRLGKDLANKVKKA